MVDTSPDPVGDGTIRILPEAGHEVSAILLLIVDNHATIVGSVKEDLNRPDNVMVLLGTKVSDGHPSCVGFRVLLRTDSPKSKDSGSIENHYHVISCRFDPHGGSMTYAKATAQDKQEILATEPARKTFSAELKPGSDQELYRMKFVTSDTNGFNITHHGPNLQSRDGGKIEKMMPFIAYAKEVSLFFIADKLLIKYLEQAVQQDCVGIEAPSWKTALPENTIPTWPSGVQTQMVKGSTDPLNVLLKASREQLLRDGAGTWVSDRLEARHFKDFVLKTYPAIRQEPTSKAYPIMLNVSGHSLCTELPFGASMLNRANTYATINSVHGLLRNSISPSRIAIVTLYPAQAEVYKEALERCHKFKADTGYNLIQVELVENWAQKTAGVAIVDLVRTSNASGNLGYLSQANRLKVLLSRHENGLIIVGDRTCTITSHNNVTSSKLDKVLEWFVDHGRIVQISQHGLPLSTPFPITAALKPSLPMERTTSADSTASEPLAPSAPEVEAEQPLRRPRYVGIPGLEHVRLENRTKDERKASFEKEISFKGRGAPDSLQMGQGFPTKGSSRSSSKASTPAMTPSVPSVKNGDRSAEAPADANTSSVKQDIPKLFDTTAAVQDGAKNVQDDGLSNEKATDKTQKDVAMVASPWEKETSRPVMVSSNGNADDDTLAGLRKAPTLSSSKHSDPQDDSKVPVEKSKNPHMEVSANVFNKLLEKTSSKLTPQVEKLSTIDRTAIRADTSKEVIENLISSAVARHGTGKENAPVARIDPVQPPIAKSEKSTTATTEKPSPKLPPHKASIKKSSRDSSVTAPRGRSLVKKSSLTGPEQTPPPAAPVTQTPSVPLVNDTKDTDKTPSTSATTVAAPAQEIDIRGRRRQQKYRAIRNVYKDFGPDVPREPQKEDRLFRSLADALMDENESDFDSLYTELISMAAHAQTAVLRRQNANGN